MEGGEGRAGWGPLGRVHSSAANGHTHTSEPWHMPLPLLRTPSPRAPRGLQVSAQPLLRGASLVTNLFCHSGHIRHPLSEIPFSNFVFATTA